MRTKTNQSGRSMIEMLGVLAIIGVLSVGGIAGYSKAMQKYRTNKTIDQITQIANGVHMLYGTRPNYAGLNIGVLGKAKIIPQELIEGETIESAQRAYEEFQGDRSSGEGAALVERWIYLQQHPEEAQFTGTNPFGGRVLLSVDGDAKAFSINYLGLPEDACIDVLTQDWGGASAGLIAAGVDSTISSTYGCTGDKGSHVCSNQMPVTVQKAIDLCATMNDSQSKGVILKFR
ncbi:MAG: hypothetical protein IJ852_04850 [Alphaproteobacteria bacterium]|nr:hypothetical protein [Alphaproteobacteria bacterium]